MEFIYAIDNGILGFMHQIAEAAGGFLTPLMQAITFIGEKGILMFLLAGLLLCFPKTRKAGVCIFGAVCCGALITNVILKDAVARTRPFEAEALYREWWNFVGAPAEDGFSFPSGHVTAAMSGMTALCLARGKRYIAPAIIYVGLMGISRNYLMAHYPSDVFAAILVGLFSALVAWLITKLIYAVAEKYNENGICRFILEFDIRKPFELFKKTNKKEG